MKIFTYRILAHRKISFIFLLAIFLPSLIVGYLSLSTFSKRRETVKKILESNLWISGETALKSIEGALLDLEIKALNPENFSSLIQLKNSNQTSFRSALLSKVDAGQLFLLDDDYHIIFPVTGSEDASVFKWDKDITNSQFGRSFQRAEFFEFSQKNYSQAAAIYKECTLSAPSKQHRAMALEGLGRCLLSSEKYAEAYKVYNELSSSYGQFQNKAGHPYGITAVFQLYEISQRRNKETNPEILLDLYKKIQDGVWLLDIATYDFFIVEIESILNRKFKEGEFPEIRKSYNAIRKKESPYRQALIFTEFLERKVIPKLKERLSLSKVAGEVVPGRLLIPLEKDFCLVSYSILQNSPSEHTFYGGFCWEPNSLKNEIIPKLVEDLKQDSGLGFQIIDERGCNIITGKEEITPTGSLALSFRLFPLPWRLLVSHPEIKTLERTASREIFFYGILLTVIIALMLLGAFLIARDISRESETTRLKTEFVHNISHELKTPLTLIRLYGETLQRKKNLTNRERKECYQIITKESERLSHLINNVLDFSRIEMGRKEFYFKKGSLAKVVRDTLESYRYHLEKKGVAIQTAIASDLPEMSFDGEALASVLINLLSNALKFSPANKEVTVKLFRDDENAVLQVADKGIGISPAEVSKIFQRFYQSKNKIVSETRGSGLGLTLVKHTVEAHGGRIQVDSEPGKGSIFSVILPISTTGEKEKIK
ncbi:MAG TPA: ATP-binding protein [archaeon]|nr:ATP-binding protein [archaeon]